MMMKRRSVLASIVACMALGTVDLTTAPSAEAAPARFTEAQVNERESVAWSHGWEYGLAHGKAITEQESAPSAVVFGALFDFMGYLTTRPEPMVLSSNHTVYALMDAYEAWLKERGIDGPCIADVTGWQARLVDDDPSIG